MDIPKLVKDQRLPEGEYIVAGGGILNALNIRESEDIDLVVTSSLYKTLKDKGWKEVNKGTYNVLEHDPFEAGLCWDGDKNEMQNIDDLLSDAVYVNDVPFTSLERLRSWKSKMKRDKDIRDIKLIDEYLNTQKNN